MENINQPLVNKRDYALISFIGLSFALFSIPILQNINLAFLPITVTNILLLIIFFTALANFGLWFSAIIARKIPVILQVAKYGAVGAFNTFLDWGVVNLLIAVTTIAAGFWFSVFAGIGFIIANIGSFFWNKYWTFSAKGEQQKATEMAQFFAVSLIGFGVKVGIATLVVNVIGAPEGFDTKQWANIGNVSGTMFSMVWNFIGYKFWVFKK
ncbi:MAG TPA: hypothetical protein DCX32_03845 [Candidatus Moranbacteria bacterium]|nr:MAG: hypothetical protein UW87_C0019G0003 [Candidatus Moranbacteria bacterium GW2011_GWC2_45_10]KKT94420.1 MAG: hypothetical protein UW95_C0015G0023 [Parcubacteria group bacterium GW2011_GWC1_45_14]HAV11642.1 hypothetical protein [Candidatus Moranbacteria bacterium]